MVSVDQWEQHFKTMANRAFLHEDMYEVNKGGRGIGRNSFPRTTYKIRKPTGPTPTVEIVSPMAQTVERAKALFEPIKGGNQTLLLFFAYMRCKGYDMDIIIKNTPSAQWIKHWIPGLFNIPSFNFMYC